VADLGGDNLNTSMDKYQKDRKCHDIFDIFENIVIFSNPAYWLLLFMT